MAKKRLQYTVDIKRALITGDYAQDVYRAMAKGVSARIINHMVKNGDKAYFANEISKELHLEQKTVSYNVKQMLSLGIFRRAHIPVDEVDYRKQYFTLNWELLQNAVEAAEKLYGSFIQISEEDYED